MSTAMFGQSGNALSAMYVIESWSFESYGFVKLAVYLFILPIHSCCNTYSLVTLWQSLRYLRSLLRERGFVWQPKVMIVKFDFVWLFKIAYLKILHKLANLMCTYRWMRKPGKLWRQTHHQSSPLQSLNNDPGDRQKSLDKDKYPPELLEKDKGQGAW